MEEATSYALFFLSPFPMSWNGSSSESVVAMELAIRRELAFRAGQTQRGPQSLQSTPQQLQLPNQNSPSPPLPPPASAAMVDSLLCKRGLERKRLRDAAMELGFSRTTRPTIPVEIAMKREMAFRRLVEGAERRGLEQWPLMLCSGEAAQSSASSFGGEECDFFLSPSPLLCPFGVQQASYANCSCGHPQIVGVVQGSLKLHPAEAITGGY